MLQGVTEYFEPIVDFFKMKTKKELVAYIGIPFIIGGVYWITCQLFCAKNAFQLDVFMNDFINALITVMALFVTFSLTYLTILITSSSENVKDLKASASKVYEIDKNPVTLFQVLMCDLVYTIFLEIIILVISFVQKFLISISSFSVIRVFIIVDIILLSHIILMILRIVKNLYFSFWKAK